MSVFRMKLWSKKNIQEMEEYRLVTSVEKARKSLVRVQSWRILESDWEEGLQSQIPVMLAELRYRYLLGQARKRGMVNRWFYEMKDNTLPREG